MFIYVKASLAKMDDVYTQIKRDISLSQVDFNLNLVATI